MTPRIRTIISLVALMLCAGGCGDEPETTPGDTSSADMVDTIGSVDAEVSDPLDALEDTPAPAEVLDDIEGEVTTVPGVDPSVFTYCAGVDDPAATATPVTIDYGAGAEVGAIQDLEAGDKEAMQIIPLHPLVVDHLVFHVTGEPGTMLIHLYGDYGRSWPDEADDLVEPMTVEVADVTQPVTVDVAAADLTVYPHEHLWVVYEHVGAGPFLLLDDGSDGESMSRYKSAAQIAEWEAEGLPYKWGAFEKEDYKIEVYGSYICQVASPLFADVTDVWGLAGLKEQRLALGDYDGDGDDDLLVHLSGAPTDETTGLKSFDTGRLFQNQGETFVEVTEEAGIAGRGANFGIFADLDGDGDEDLVMGVYVGQDAGSQETDNGARSHVLMNDGGVFTPLEVPAIALDAPVSAGALADYDHDGILDLYLGTWLLEYPYPGAAADGMFHGSGDGTFEDVTDAMGLTWSPAYMEPAYGAMWADYNDDGWSDAFVFVYGREPNVLWYNDGGTVFYNVAGAVDLDVDGIPMGGGNTFGGDFADFDNDGDLDAFLANISHPRYHPSSDISSLNLNTGAPDYVFVDVRVERGIAYDEGDIDGHFVDFDNDGLLDLFVVSLYPHHFSRVYHQNPDHTFTDVTYMAGIGVEECVSHVFTDIDGDGDVDLLSATRKSGGAIYLFENEIGSQNHWLHVSLEGTTATTDAAGARIYLTMGDGTVQLREVKVGGSHFNMQSSMVQYFGLGPDGTIASLEVVWPGGATQVVEDVTIDSLVHVVQTP